MVERLVELRRHLEHLRRLRPNVTGPDVLREDLSLHNDVFHSLLTICQLVIDIAGELSANAGRRFESYTEAVRNLRHDGRFSNEIVATLAQLPGMRNVLVHEYLTVNMDLVIAALDNLGPVEEFMDILARDVTPPATPDPETR